MRCDGILYPSVDICVKLDIIKIYEKLKRIEEAAKVDKRDLFLGISSLSQLL